MKAGHVEYDQLFIRSFGQWDLYLHQSQVFLGRCYLALKSGQAIDPFEEGSDEEWSTLIYIVRHRLIPALRRLWEPDKLDYGNLRNVWPVCHWHIVPRYMGKREFAGEQFVDERWGHNWSPYSEKVFPDEILVVIRDALREKIG